MTDREGRELLILSRIILAVSDLQFTKEPVSRERVVNAALNYGKHLKITTTEVEAALKKSIQDVIWPTT